MQERLFPLEAKVNKVLGVLSLLAQNSGKVKLSYLSRVSKSDVNNLLSDVEAARMLGLVKVNNDQISITTLGSELHDNVAGVKRKVSDRLKEIEPFKSAYSMTKEKGYIVGDDVVDRIAKKGFYLQTDPKKNRAAIDTILLQWGIMFGIISYDGKERVWGKAD